MRVLIVEDERELADILDDYLRREGYATERAHDGARALELWRAARPDLILLDVMLPKVDGFEVARRVRAESDVPIIMLTARDEEVDTLLGLGLGADDYVVKPYSPREVVARAKAVLRRARGATGPSTRFVVGPLEVDVAAYLCRCHGRDVSLTPAEVRLLAALAREPERVRTRAELLDASADERSDGLVDERVVDTHVKNLRKKLGRCAVALETVRGVGYRLRAAAS